MRHIPEVLKRRKPGAVNQASGQKKIESEGAKHFHIFAQNSPSLFSERKLFKCLPRPLENIWGEDLSGCKHGQHQRCVGKEFGSSEDKHHNIKGESQLYEKRKSN